MGLKDFFGRVFKETARPETRELSAVSLAERWSSYPSAGLTPNRLAEIFREADQGNVIARWSCSRRWRRRTPTWRPSSRPGSWRCWARTTRSCPMPGPRRMRRSRRVGEMVYAIPNLEEALLDLLDAIGKGFALWEILWEVAGGQARVAELRWIPQKKVTFGEDLEAPAADAGGPLARGGCPPGR